MLLVRDPDAGHYKLDVVQATEERKKHGGVVEKDRFVGGVRVLASYAEPSSAYEALARDGLLGVGAELTRRLSAADWFHRQAEAARLRSRVSGTYVDGGGGEIELSDHQARARQRLRVAGEAIGGEAFDVLVDVITWDIRPLIQSRITRLLAALDLLVRYLKLPGGS